MIKELDCGVCGKTTSSFFMVLGTETICTDCEKKTPKHIPGKFQRPPTFARYICKTHNCGTYNVGNMTNRHEMKDCDIVIQITLGIIRPATFGGYNGDISKKYFLGTNEMVRLATNLTNYKRFARIHSRIGVAKTSYIDKKFYNKHLRFLGYGVDINYNKHDSAFLKLKFNLDVYIQSVIPRVRKHMMTNEERNSLYYKNLMNNFRLQVIEK